MRILHITTAADIW